MSAKQNRNQLIVTVTQNRMEATIAVVPDANLAQLGAPDVVAALGQARVTVSAEVKSKIAEYLDWLRGAAKPGEAFIIAQGKSAEEGVDGFFEPAPALACGALPSFVTEGTPIGRIVAPRPGVSGWDVHRNELLPERIPAPVAVKHNITIAEDGRSLTAAVTGRVTHDETSVCIQRALVVAGDLDSKTGDLELGVDILVRGTIRDGLQVKTPGALFVEGAIESAAVEAADVVVQGGIAGGENGVVRTKGIIKAKFVNNGVLNAEGDVVLENECLNSQVNSNGRLLLEQGPIIGGVVFARRAVKARILGSDTGLPTSVAAGLSDALLETHKTHEKEQGERRATLKKNKEELAALKTLPKPSAKDREKMTELAFEIPELEAVLLDSGPGGRKSAPDSAKAGGAADQEESAEAYVLISERVWRGVTVRIDDRTATFEQNMNGPLKLSLTHNRGERFIVATDPVGEKVLREWKAEVLTAV